MSLDDKLRAAGLDPGAPGDPVQAFRTLHETMGEQATVVDRYVLEARHRGVDLDDVSMSDRQLLATEVLALRGFELLGNSSRDEPLIVEPYDEAWEARFEQWHSRLADVLADAALSIDHMGSTAVPGLAAKPTVDILIAVTDVEGEASYVAKVESTGLALRSREVDHRYFRRPKGEPRVVQVHVCGHGGGRRRQYLLFRDYLRAHAPTAAEYGLLKLGLAAEFTHDRVAYTDMKGEFIRQALHDAELWVQESDWTPS